jgi:hypothetical protein
VASARSLPAVIVGPDPAIHASTAQASSVRNVDRRVKPGDDNVKKVREKST